MRPTPDQLRALYRRDPALGRVARRMPPFPDLPMPPHRRMSAYEYLARAIVFQQLAYPAANTIWGRVRDLVPGPRCPTAAELLRLPENLLRGAGLSRNKMASLLDLAEQVESGALKLNGLGRLDDEAVVDRLVTVRGIGPWTAQMYLMFKLGRLDVLPGSDLGVQEGVRILDGLVERPTAQEVLARGEAWKPLRTVASWICWRLTDGEEP